MVPFFDRRTPVRQKNLGHRLAGLVDGVVRLHVDRERELRLGTARQFHGVRPGKVRRQPVPDDVSTGRPKRGNRLTEEMERFGAGDGDQSSPPAASPMLRPPA